MRRMSYLLVQAVISIGIVVKTVHPCTVEAASTTLRPLLEQAAASASSAATSNTPGDAPIAPCAQPLDSADVRQIITSTDTDAIKAKEMMLIVKRAVNGGWASVKRPDDFTNVLNTIILEVVKAQSDPDKVAKALEGALNALCAQKDSDVSKMFDAARQAAELPSTVKMSSAPTSSSGCDPLVNRLQGMHLLPTESSTSSFTDTDRVRQAEAALQAVLDNRGVLGEAQQGLKPDAAAKQELLRKAVLQEGVQCEMWVAGRTLDAQDKASIAATQVIGKFNVSAADNSQLATTHIITALSPLSLEDGNYIEKEHKKNLRELDPRVNTHIYSDIGFDVSASVPIQSATLMDYARQELLIRDGGLVNFYTSLSGRNYANQAYTWGNRQANVDRLYWFDLKPGFSQPVTGKELLIYVSQAVGVKALKTQLEGTGGLGAQGTCYVGIGVDGPTYSSGAKQGSPDGTFSFELYLSGNIVTRNALNSLLGTKDTASAYPAYGANLTFYVTDTISINVQYGSPMFSSVSRALGHVAMVQVGYNKLNSSAPNQSRQNSGT